MDGVADQLQQYPTLKYDPAQSAAIMTRKGYTRDGDGMWVDGSGQRVSFQIVTFPQHPSATPVAPIITQQLKRAGFAVLIASEIQMLRDFGIVTVIDLGAALLGVMVVLPAALVWIEER